MSKQEKHLYEFGPFLLDPDERLLTRDRDAVSLTPKAFDTLLVLVQNKGHVLYLYGVDLYSANIVFYRGFGRYYLKDYSGAAADFNRAYKLDPTLYSQVGKALSEHIDGHTVGGLEILKALEKKIAERGVRDAEAIYKMAQAYAVLGDEAGALRLFQRSVEGGFFCYPYFINDPLLENIRSEPGYAAIIAQARQRHEEVKRRFF